MKCARRNDGLIGHEYQKLGEDEPENLVPERRRRWCISWSSYIGLVTLLSILSLVLVYFFGNCECFIIFESTELINSSSSQNCSVDLHVCSNGFLLTGIPFITADFILARITYLLILLAEEWNHKKRRHKGSIRKMLAFVFRSEGKIFIPFALLLITTMHVLYKFGCYPIPFCYCDALLIITFYLLFFTFNYQNRNGIEQAESTSAIIGGSLAVWFYIGYLKLVLCPNDQNPSIKQRIKEYKEREKLGEVLFPEKLFILFPTSCYTHHNLANADSTRISERQRLGELIIERAGVTERKFNNSVYEFTDDAGSGTDKKYLAVVEYATPLVTLYNLTQSGIAGVHLTKEDKTQQLFTFYRELKNLLENDPAVSNMYVLVLYDDENAKDKPSCMLNALLKKIKEHL